MLENVLQNRHYMLVCIQYEVLQGTPIFWAYQNFCKSIGDDVMNYKEFDDWYYHFYNGEFNLDRDRSLDPKKAELKDMPVDVMGNIIENLDFGERAILRKVSHNLCETVDNYKQHFEEISLKFVYEKTVLKFDDREIGYFDKKSESENSENPSENSSENPEDVNVEKEKPWTLALRDLSTVLKNPKLKIDKLSIDFDESLRDAKRLIVEESTQKTLEKNFQIPAKSLHLNVKNQQSVLAVLPYLKPGFLENLHIKHYAFTSMEISAKIGDLEQWKKAKFLEIDRGIKCSVEHFFHFTKMNIDLRQVSNSDVIWLRDTLLTSPTFEECQLGFITIFHRYKPYGTKNIPIPGSSNGGYLSTEYGDQYIIHPSIMSSSGSIIKLNIGGTVFQTTKSTLTRYDGFFKTILETEIPVTKDETGAIFIDRDPKHFRLVLNFMRDGDVTLPNSEQELEEILKEAQYYLLEGLMEKCKNRIPSEICEIIKRLNEFGAQKEPNPCFQLTVIIHYRIEDWSVVFREISPEQFVYRAPFQTLFKKIDRSKYIPNYWSYTLRYSTTIGSVFKETTLGSENIDVEDFLEELSKNIRELGTGTKLDGFLEF